MIKPLSLVSLAMLAVLSLTSCVASSDTQEPEETFKQAGTLGSRICFTNATALPMTAAPSQKVEIKNADHIVGAAGALTDTSPLCFAGWRSYYVDLWKAEADSPGFWTKIEQDVSLSVGIDGYYNVLNFRAMNESVRKPSLEWTTNSESTNNWSGDVMSEGETVEGSAAGHKFSVSRINDSQYYKEFTVRFTQ